MCLRQQRHESGRCFCSESLQTLTGLNGPVRSNPGPGSDLLTGPLREAACDGLSPSELLLPAAQTSSATHSYTYTHSHTPMFTPYSRWYTHTHTDTSHTLCVQVTLSNVQIQLCQSRPYTPLLSVYTQIS